MDKNAFLIQILVRNYLEKEFEMKSSFYLYEEILNDTDVFTQNLRNIKELKRKFSSSRPAIEPPHIEAFFDLIEEGSYLYSYDVKYSIKQYMYQFQHIYQIISRARYPDNTELQIIVVPSENVEDDATQNNITVFEDYKHKILELSEEDKYKIFNSFAHDKSLEKDDASDVFLRFYIKAQRGTLKPTYGTSDISAEDAKILENNLSKLTIRVITLSELLKYPLTVEFLKSSLMF